MSILETTNTSTSISSLVNNPLVSIVVITYNSSKYVLETLESAKAQTYQNIELVVTDDCSTDDTVAVCKKWLAQNKERFVRTELLTVEKNRGIAANCNRGVNSSYGEWFKIIAGDDSLMSDCIESFIGFCKQEPEARIIQSQCDFYLDYLTSSNFMYTGNLESKPITIKEVTAIQQYQILLSGNVVQAPSVFMSRKIFIKVGGYDEIYYIEDWPMWLKITKNNYKIYYLSQSTVKYRVHNNSASRIKNKKKLYTDFYKKNRLFIVKKILPELPFIKRVKINHEYYVYLTYDKIGLNRKNIICKIMLELTLFNIIRNLKSWHKKRFN